MIKYLVYDSYGFLVRECTSKQEANIIKSTSGNRFKIIERK